MKRWVQGVFVLLICLSSAMPLQAKKKKKMLSRYTRFLIAKGWEVCLRAHKGQYVSADASMGQFSSSIFANRSQCRKWERFKIISINKKKTLRHNDKIRILTTRYKY